MTDHDARERKQSIKTKVARDSATSLADWVYNELRHKVVDGGIRPGDRLREVELADSLSVSRTPIREALKRLEADGLLTYLPSRGAVIASLTPEQAIELYTLREALEATAARLAAHHALDHEISRLRELLARHKAAEDDTVLLAGLNRSFHSAVYRMSRNRYLIEALNRVQDYVVLLSDTGYRVAGRPASAYEEHKAIVEAIARRDPDAAEAASRRHSREALRVRMTLEFGEHDATARE